MMIFNTQEERDQIRQNLGSISFEDQRVLVTGGAGFIGSWMCETLIDNGAFVICIDNFASGMESNISGLMNHENFQFINHDITTPLHFDSKIDLVFHMASRASPFEFEHYPIQILKSNTLGVLVSLGIAKKYGARFVYTSTSEVYGNPNIVPTPESYFGNVNPLGPRGCYDEAKRCGEAFVVAYQRQHNLNTRIARIFNTYGRVVPRFINQALLGISITIFGDGSQTRSFTYITDQIEGLMRLAAADEARGEVINIGNINEIMVLELARKIVTLTRSPSDLTFSPLPMDDPLRRRPDITKARKILSWEPKVPLDKGLHRTIDWVKDISISDRIRAENEI
jgi:UDP-glucuronate decarboxylase